MARAHSGSPLQEHPSFASGQLLVCGPSSGAPTLDWDSPWAWTQSSRAWWLWEEHASRQGQSKVPGCLTMA